MSIYLYFIYCHTGIVWDVLGWFLVVFYPHLVWKLRFKGGKKENKANILMIASYTSTKLTSKNCRVTNCACFRSHRLTPKALTVNIYQGSEWIGETDKSAPQIDHEKCIKIHARLMVIFTACNEGDPSLCWSSSSSSSLVQSSSGTQSLFNGVTIITVAVCFVGLRLCPPSGRPHTATAALLNIKQSSEDRHGIQRQRKEACRRLPRNRGDVFI